MAFVLLFIASAPLLYPELIFRKVLLWFSLIYPFIAFVLIKGGMFSLDNGTGRRFLSISEICLVVDNDNPNH